MVKNSKKGAHMASRIKKMMQADEDVGKISQATPHLISRGMECFLEKLVKHSAEIAQQAGSKVLTPSHLKAYVNQDPLMDFVKEIVESAPDLGAEPEPKLKRQRTAPMASKTKDPVTSPAASPPQTTAAQQPPPIPSGTTDTKPPAPTTTQPASQPASEDHAAAMAAWSQLKRKPGLLGGSGSFASSSSSSMGALRPPQSCPAPPQHTQPSVGTPSLARGQHGNPMGNGVVLETTTNTCVAHQHTKLEPKPQGQLQPPPVPQAHAQAPKGGHKEEAQPPVQLRPPPVPHVTIEKTSQRGATQISTQAATITSTHAAAAAVEAQHADAQRPSIYTGIPGTTPENAPPLAPRNSAPPPPQTTKAGSVVLPGKTSVEGIPGGSERGVPSLTGGGPSSAGAQEVKLVLAQSPVRGVSGNGGVSGSGGEGLLGKRKTPPLGGVQPLSPTRTGATLVADRVSPPTKSPPTKSPRRTPPAAHILNTSPTPPAAAPGVMQQLLQNLQQARAAHVSPPAATPPPAAATPPAAGSKAATEASAGIGNERGSATEQLMMMLLRAAQPPAPQRTPPPQAQATPELQLLSVITQLAANPTASDTALQAKAYELLLQLVDKQQQQQQAAQQQHQQQQLMLLQQLAGGIGNNGDQQAPQLGMLQQATQLMQMSNGQMPLTTALQLVQAAQQQQQVQRQKQQQQEAAQHMAALQMLLGAAATQQLQQQQQQQQQQRTTPPQVGEEEQQHNDGATRQ